LRIAHKPIASREGSDSPDQIEDLLVPASVIAVNAATWWVEVSCRQARTKLTGLLPIAPFTV